jgi:hypothetical protein
MFRQPRGRSLRPWGTLAPILPVPVPFSLAVAGMPRPAVTVAGTVLRVRRRIRAARLGGERAGPHLRAAMLSRPRKGGPAGERSGDLH